VNFSSPRERTRYCGHARQREFGSSSDGARLTGSEVPLRSFAARSLPCVAVSWGSSAGKRGRAHFDDIGPQDQAGRGLLVHGAQFGAAGAAGGD